MKTRIAAALVASLLSTAGHAATISTSAVKGGVAIALYGRIVDGDAARFRQALDSVHGQSRFVGLNSGGGAIDEATEIAELVHSDDLPVVVVSGSTCASACFLILAAAPTKFVGETARIGVHNGSLGGVDNAGATVEMAKFVSKFGVPPAIIGKMAVTGSETLAWLTPDELRSMGAQAVPLRQQPTPGVTPTVDPVFASLSSDQQEMVTGLAAEVTRLLKDGGIARVNRAIEACYGVATQRRTVKAVQRCAALDIAATSITYALKIDSPFNTYDALAQRGADMRRVVALPMSRVEESNNIATATVNLIAGVAAK